MSSVFDRLRHRWTTALRFAGSAQGWRDYASLFLAGIAREQPFHGTSGYARLGRILATNVAPRIAAANGSRLALDLRNATDLMVFEEIFLDRIYPLDRVPFTPDTVVDCGACAGFFTVLAHARYPKARYHMFEPNPRNIERLRHNLALNDLHAEVHANAVGSADGEAFFAGDGFGGHLVAGVTPDNVKVRVESLPGVLHQLGPVHLLLKIDIEGAEADLLPVIGPSLPRSTAIFLETHHADAVRRAYLQPLLDAGFRHQVIRQRHDATIHVDYVEQMLLRH